MMKIRELNIGELDARFEDINNFNDKYIILPDQISYEDIIANRNLYYLIGNKGTGKTALLLYISNKLKSEHPESVCSTILFKTKFDSIEKTRLESLNNQIFQTMEIDSTELISVNDFKNIWKLEIYFKIVYDNRKCNYTIFENNTNWHAYEDMVLRLTSTLGTDVEEKLQLFNKIPKAIIYDQDKNTLTISPEQIEYPTETSNISLQQFNNAIKILDIIFSTLTRQKSPYYICIDELETAFSSPSFCRDIQMIHDWIEVVWYFNERIKQNNYENMKLILSVRNEILNSISKNLFGDEINKKTGSFGKIIEWRTKHNPVNTPIKNLYTPVIQIMLKKIMISSQEDSSIKSEDLYVKWFDTEIAGQDTAAFIYERTWGKPRDAVRFLSVAKQFADSKSHFDKQLLIDMQKTYSIECQKEIYEEMSACYSQDTVTALFESLDGYKASFSNTEYEEEARLSPELSSKFNSTLDILKILFSFGIIGCRNEKSEINRWSYNGDQFIEGHGWRFIVHPGLKVALNLEETEINGIYLYQAIGTCVECKIEKRTKSFLNVSFYYNSINCPGNIHISKIQKDQFWNEIPNTFDSIKSISAYIIGYNNYYQKWELSCFAPYRNNYREE